MILQQEAEETHLLSGALARPKRLRDNTSTRRDGDTDVCLEKVAAYSMWGGGGEWVSQAAACFPPRLKVWDSVKFNDSHFGAP